MEDVARRAGVSRMTVFRRFENEQGLVEVVISREVRRGMEELDLLWEGAETLEERLVEGFAFAGRYVRDHPLFDGLLQPEPESCCRRSRSTGDPCSVFIEHSSRSDFRLKSMRVVPATPDVDGVAEVIARLAISLLLTREGEITVDDPDSVVRLVLLPMLQPQPELSSPGRSSERDPPARQLIRGQAVARTATSYFPTEVRWPGVSSVGIALSVASARL